MRDVMKVAIEPNTKTHLYRFSNAAWYSFLEVFDRLISNNWLEISEDHGGIGDLYCLTRVGRIYYENLSDMLSSID